MAIIVMTASAVAQVKVSFEQARPVVEALRSNLPAALRGLSPGEIEARWASWIESHDRAVRARLARGDEDSLVNLWLYGTSFTSRAPAIARDADDRLDVEGLARTRLEDFLAAVSAPGTNERLQFARRVLAARGTDPGTGEGRSRARQFMLDARRRMTMEFAESGRLLTSAAREGAGAGTGAAATVFRERGLSSDTSILADYSVATALEAISKQKLLRAGDVRRVAIVGPGLDFTNKADGYDFYPQQTIQPFALLDTLRRAGLAASGLRITTLDISSRVNEHLTAAAGQATSARGYVLTLPLDGTGQWTPGVLDYWRIFGSAIGNETSGPGAPFDSVRVRSIRLHPDVVHSLTPRDLNIVVERLPLEPGERFDLVVATNVLLYYDVFEQALAVANVAAMLRPGGVFLTNTAVFPTPPLKSSASYLRVAHTTDRYDEMFWYVRD